MPEPTLESTESEPAAHDLFDTMATCRSMRRLHPDPVPKALIRRLIEAASLAPSGRNLQRARWIVVTDTAQRERIAVLNRRVSLDHAAIERDADRELPHHDREQRRRMWEAVLWQAEHFHEVPVIIVACCIMDDEAQDPGRYAGSIWPGVQNLLLTARALGLGATPTTYALTYRDELEAILGLPSRVRAQAVIPVGFPRGQFGPVRRLPVDDVMMSDRWQGDIAGIP